MDYKISSELSNVSSQIIEKIKDRPNGQELYKHYMDGGKCDGWVCSPSVVDAFSKKLAENGISHVCVQNVENGEKVVLVAKENDRNQIQQVKDGLVIGFRSPSETSLTEMKANNVGVNVHAIRGTSETYAAIFKEEAKNAGMKISITNNKDGTYDIYYSGKDREKANSVIMNTVVATRGTIGKFNQERIAGEIQKEKNIYNQISNPQKEFYVVSHAQPNEYMRFTSAGYEHYRNGQLIGDELRNNQNFQIDAHKRIDSSFVRPLVLSKEEFEEVKKLSREEYIKQISARHKTLVPNRDDIHRMELERMAKVLAEYKMSLDNNQLNNNYYDSTVRIAAFEAREEITDKQIDRETEMAVSNPKSMPPEVETTIDKQESLPKEDREYIEERVKEYVSDTRRTREETETIEVTREVIKEDLDIMIASLSVDAMSTETISTEIDFERE